MMGIGGLAGAGPEGLDFEGGRWEQLFVGDYTKAKEIMTRLDEAEAALAADTVQVLEDGRQI
jgi:hypothetical protein